MMEFERKEKRNPSLLKFLFLLFLVGVVALVVSPFFYQPDRPVVNIVPGSSAGPKFVVQIIRPRVGLPLGGLLPPKVFGLESSLKFDSDSEGAMVGQAASDRIELAAGKSQLVLVIDQSGQVTPDTFVVFELTFEDKPRTFRGWAGDPAEGKVVLSKLEEANELSGHFDIKIARCEDAETGERIDWPAEPLLLHGSFDRLPIK